MSEYHQQSELIRLVQQEQNEFFSFIRDRKNSTDENTRDSARDGIANHLKVLSPAQLSHPTLFNVMLWTGTVNHPYCKNTFSKDDFDRFVSRRTIPRESLNTLFDWPGTEGDSHRRTINNNQDVMEFAYQQSAMAETFLKLIDLLITKLSISIQLNENGEIFIDLEAKKPNVISKQGLIKHTSGIGSLTIFHLFNDHPRPEFARAMYLRCCRENVNRLQPNQNIQLL